MPEIVTVHKPPQNEFCGYENSAFQAGEEFHKMEIFVATERPIFYIHVPVVA